ncbi:MAG TPA: TIGR02996 domain-containing protein [Kofleriaceae bacterium]|nr:TIGR02996 domain-containing protein [Kofleriaceae bacterium]
MRAIYAPLLAEVIADPRAIAPRLVYGDALLEAGEPRGELIQIQRALEELDADDPARDALEARAADLLALRHPGWTRELHERYELHDRASELRYRHSFVERAELRAFRVPALMPILTELTPLRELRISFGTRAEDLGRSRPVSEHGPVETDAEVPADSRRIDL